MLDMGKFLQEFNKQYDFIYRAEEKGMYVAGTDEAIDYFENNRTEKETKILSDFVKYRKDFISSDREVTAFMFTIDKLCNV